MGGGGGYPLKQGLMREGIGFTMANGNYITTTVPNIILKKLCTVYLVFIKTLLAKAVM